jgi:DNA-binding transcriptional LysR family regulator
MNLTKIRYFVEVARCGNFSEAARRLYTAQPNVSKQIAQMEQELDASLFIRTKRSVRLTPAGQLLYDNIKDLPEQLEALFDQVRALSKRDETHLTIGILEGQEVNSILLTRLNLAQELYPNLDVEMERNSFSNLRSGLKTGHYDLIVTLDFDVEQEPEFAWHPIFAQPPAIAINRNHPLAGQERLDMPQLQGEDFVVISPQESPVGYERFITQCQKTGFTPHVVRQPRSLESLILCVELGVGVALLDQNTRLGHSSTVRTVPISGKDMYVVAAYMKEDYRPILKNVVDILCQHENGPQPSQKPLPV